MSADSWNILRSQGKVRIRKQLWYKGPIHRAEIADALSLSLPAVTTVINTMIDGGTVCEKKLPSLPGRPTMGRRASVVDIVEDARYFVGVEMRRDSRSVCLTDYRGTVLSVLRESTTLPDYEKNITAVCALIRQLLLEHPIPPEKAAALGVAVPGVVDDARGVLVAHRMYGWYDQSIAMDIAEKTGWRGPITVGNDACTRAFGARMLRRDRFDGIDTFAYLLIARGISCPFLPVGPADVGAPLGIGEIGYMMIQADNAISAGHIAGNLSDLAGERAIMDRCYEAMRRGEAPILLNICGGDTRPTIPQILEAQKRGEGAVQLILEAAFRYLSVALANVYNFVQPDLIFIDSRLFSAAPNRKILTDSISQYLMTTHKTQPAFEFAEPEPEYGARCAALSAIRYDLNQCEEAWEAMGSPQSEQEEKIS